MKTEISLNMEVYHAEAHVHSGLDAAGNRICEPFGSVRFGDILTRITVADAASAREIAAAFTKVAELLETAP